VQSNLWVKKSPETGLKSDTALRARDEEGPGGSGRTMRVASSRHIGKLLDLQKTIFSLCEDEGKFPSPFQPQSTWPFLDSSL
jgi:hypothetical protein